MNKPLTRSADGRSFTLTINGEHRTYANDKDGKRQAILDGLNAIPTVTVATPAAGDDIYLPSNDALQAVAAVLYPDGIQTESAYQTVCDVTEKACAHIGYGAEESLGPPRVPFSARGSYRKRYPSLAAQLVLDELERAGAGSSRPRQEVAGLRQANSLIGAYSMVDEEEEDEPLPALDVVPQRPFEQALSKPLPASGNGRFGNGTAVRLPLLANGQGKPNGATAAANGNGNGRAPEPETAPGPTENGARPPAPRPRLINFSG